jgi:endonuclease/exonuclease/phosphatase family metal-dependent hydrolase
LRIRALSWNLFHGRDKPPDPDLFTLRSRLLGTTERGATHVQVNRDLLHEFSSFIATAEWDVALLQECPPRWADPLARACDAEPHGVLTSRNSLPALRAALARRNPDLIASGEGGSNLTLVRSPLRPISERRELVLRSRRPERRAMAFTRTAAGLCVANLHTTNDRPGLATDEVLLAAETALAWAGEMPLLLGGDFNLRPARHPEAFERLEERHGLTPPTEPDAIDHILARGLEIAAPPKRWPAERRELSEDGLSLRLSDHAPVQGIFSFGKARAGVT